MKIKSHDIIEKIQKGSFYMNSLRYYRQLYENSHDEVIGDPLEGKFFVHDAIIKVGDGPEEAVHDQPFATMNEDDFVFCMFGVNPAANRGFRFSEEQKEKLIAFNDTLLLILDSDEFRRRVYIAAQRNGIEIKEGFVHYYDPSVNDITPYIRLLNGADNIVFHKRKQYEYQQEYRFTVRQPKGKDYIDHLEFCIGDISDISKVYATKDFLKKTYIAKVNDLSE